MDELLSNGVIECRCPVGPANGHGGVVRKLLLALIYLGMVAFGVALTYVTLRLDGRLIFLGGGVLLVAFGVNLAWSDLFSRNRLTF
jgi:hypothetical protein